MPRGIYDHSNNKGFTGKKHTAHSRRMMSEGQRMQHAQKRIEQKIHEHIDVFKRLADK